MISESYVYKDELLKFADDLQKRRTQKRWTERTGLLIEKELFFGFFIIRKLCEAVKISNSLKAKDFKVSVLPIAAPFDINVTTEHKVLENIDWEKQIYQKMSIIQICNQFIHSFLMLLVSKEDGGLESVLISSDWFKSKKCFLIDLEIIIQIFQEFGNNYPYRISWRRDRNCKIIEYIIE